MATWFERFRSAILLLIGLVGGIATYLSTFELIKVLAGGGNELILAVLYIVLLSASLIVWVGFREYQTIRKEKYANITERLHNISHELRNMQTIINSSKPRNNASQETFRNYIERCKLSLVDTLDEVSVIFSMLTGTKCRATIKIISNHENNRLYVDTLSRDKSSTNRNSELDNYRLENNMDLLDENPEFKNLFSVDVKKWSFICNNLQRQQNFLTTSLAAYSSDAGKKVYEPSLLERIFGSSWQLPYRSTLTCAIRQQPMEDHLGQPEAVGFLCIDSESRNVFEQRWDEQLCFSIADALFHPVDHLVKTMTIAAERNQG